MGGAGVLPSLLSLLLVIAVAGAAAGADAMIRPGAGNKVLEKFCDRGCKEAYQCHTVSGDECPSPSASGHHSSSDQLLLTDDSAVVGEVVTQQQVQAVGGTLCCSNMTGFHECVEACFASFPPQDAAIFCDSGCKEAYQCHTVSGEECPSSGHRSSSDDDSSAKENAVDHCILGCNSSVCNKMVTGVGRKGVVKHAVERCNNACYKFCTPRVSELQHLLLN